MNDDVNSEFGIISKRKDLYEKTKVPVDDVYSTNKSAFIVHHVTRRLANNK